MDSLKRDAIAELVARLTAERLLDGRQLVIGVAGESGSGKSTAATQLAEQLNAQAIPTAFINQDNYFLRPPRTNHAFRLQDLAHVGPHEVQLALIGEHLRAFREGRSVSAPEVNYPANRFETVTRDFAGMQVLIVEGTYVLLLEDLDVRVFLEATHRDTHERRMARNRDIWEPIIDTILDIEHHLIAPQADRAHWLIDREFHLRRGPAHGV
ncbi:uridine kinase family protein [Gemmatimonas sp.]